MSWKPLGAKIRALFKSLNRRAWIRIAVAFAVILVILLVVLLRSSPDPYQSDELASVYDRGVLRIGVRCDVPSFGYEDSDGNRTGFEVDLANDLSARIFDTAQVEFTTVNFNMLTAKLKNGTLDCCIALAQDGMSTALVYSDPYYTDAVAIMVMSSSSYQSPSDLAGRTIGCVNRDGTNMRYAARNALNEFANAQGPKCTVVEYSSSSDMIADLAKGKLDGVCMEYSLLFSYYSADTHRILPQAIGTISYSIAFRPGSEYLVQIANDMIKEMRADGSLDALLAKWSLEDYSEK